MSDLIVAVAMAVGAAVALRFFYVTVSSEWPENYSSVRSTLESQARGSLLRYVLLRTGPAFVAALFVAVTIERRGGQVAWSLALFAVLHLGATNGRAAFSLITRNPRASRRNTLLVFYGLSAVPILVAVAAAYWGRQRLEDLVPSPVDLVVSLWAGVFAAIVAVAALRITGPSAPREDDLDSVVRDVGETHWDYIGSAALAADCDPAVLRAVVAAESVQRPRWIRVGERLKGKLIKRGSYGVAQMSSSRPLDDFESIDALAESFAGYYPERRSQHGYEYLLPERLAGRLAKHNQSPAFIEQAVSFYGVLVPYAMATTSGVAVDRRPLIEVLEVERAGLGWKLSGTASVSEGSLTCRWRGGEGPTETEVIPASQGAPLRGIWEASVPWDAHVAWIAESDADDTPEAAARTVEVDLMR